MSNKALPKLSGPERDLLIKHYVDELKKGIKERDKVIDKLLKDPPGVGVRIGELESEVAELQDIIESGRHEGYGSNYRKKYGALRKEFQRQMKCFRVYKLSH